jgi:polysaccharide pyruvyl transferase WcaK-like protein
MEARAKVSHVVITNVFNDDNRGGAALTSAAIKAATTAIPNCSVSLICVAPREEGQEPDPYRHTRASYPQAALRPPIHQSLSARWKPPPLVLLHSLLILLIPRLGHDNATIADVPTATLVMGKGGQLLRKRTLAELPALYFALYPLIFAKRVGVPTMLFGVSVGPLPDGAATQATRLLLRCVDRLVVRGAMSREEAIRLGFASGAVTVLPDTVFLHEPLAPRPESDDSRRTLVLTTADWAGFRTVARNTIAAVARELLDAGQVDEVEIVLQTDGATTSDRRASEELARQIGSVAVLVDEDHSVEQLLERYSRAHLLIGSRVHSVLLALIAGCPAIALASPNVTKSQEILEEIGLPDLAVMVDADPEATRERLSERARSILADVGIAREQLRARIQWAHEDVRLRAIAEIRSAIGG